MKFAHQHSEQATYAAYGTLFSTFGAAFNKAITKIEYHKENTCKGKLYETASVNGLVYSYI